ncbi:unnamed protein product (mitochondrion) [Plasmodiophora brassicae]|uniref:phosphoenolpyruvate carboxykinase (ATP) n=1 Tax=Plasmodiophora brassicae TaxID=37360 RepID=A0A3P3YET2_PLABS|nr:unnamed protein product [Plasmodiophora brassicae]
MDPTRVSIENGLLPSIKSALAVTPTASSTAKEADVCSRLASFGLNSSEVFHNSSPALLYEHALRYEQGTNITSAGALATLSGEKTGRSPSDKRIVDEESSRDNVWWGPVNIKLEPNSFMINRERAIDYLNTSPRLYVFDGFAGWDKKYQIKVRVICNRAYHALFMQNMLIRPTAEELQSYGDPDFTIYNAGGFPANRYTAGMTSATSVSLHFARGEMVILGTLYAGEMKKGIFTVMHYLMPKRGVLSLHSSANQHPTDGSTALFFGLSGTGKTTLSADPKRLLIGDDEHCWSDHGIFNIEGGCYAKAINLSKESEPEIFDAIRFGCVLENVVFDPVSRVVDYSDISITENTRAAYPIEYIPNALIPCVGGHPTNIILLTCDAFGVLPPVSRLTTAQAMYHFVSGYTAKIAGTEVGVTEPEATFSACFGQPFLVWHPIKYATMLAAKLEKFRCTAWLVNTGWVGGKYGVGKRCPLKYSRLIVDAIHSGELAKAEYEKFPVFNLDIPKAVNGVPAELLDPKKAWTDKAAFTGAVESLAKLFDKNFQKYKDQSTPEIASAGPKL